MDQMGSGVRGHKNMDTRYGGIYTTLLFVYLLQLICLPISHDIHI
jgi:hypothetical protein